MVGHSELPQLLLTRPGYTVCFPMHPGFVDTDMGESYVVFFPRSAPDSEDEK